MNDPKLHHYVPQFYLKLFCDKSNRVWVWDKESRKVYKTTSSRIAARTHFYRVSEFSGTQVDPLFLERDLANLERKAALILHQCVALFDDMEPMQYLQMDEDSRWDLSSYMAIQYLRTAEQRRILTEFAIRNGSYKGDISQEEQISLHARLLCASGLVEKFTERIFRSIWIYARNKTQTPFWASDNPVLFKTGDSLMWLKGGPGLFSPGTYIVFPINSSYILYCKEPEYWSSLEKADSCLSPVELTDEMVKHENAGQVFMATRHVISAFNDFSWAEEFSKTIGTDIYAPKNN
jgi:Protein of unknown function (DUF4238)